MAENLPVSHWLKRGYAKHAFLKQQQLSKMEFVLTMSVNFPVLSGGSPRWKQHGSPMFYTNSTGAATCPTTIRHNLKNFGRLIVKY